MKTSATLVLLAALFCITPVSSNTQQRGDTAVVDKFIASQESRDNGRPAEGIRTVLQGDLNHDGVPDTAVLYTMEGAGGSNNYTQYLAVFVRVNGKLVHVAHKAVGGLLYRALAIVSIKDNVILCTTKNYGKGDADCCPTIKGTTKYVLDGNELKEVKGK